MDRTIFENARDARLRLKVLGYSLQHILSNMDRGAVVVDDVAFAARIDRDTLVARLLFHDLSDDEMLYIIVDLPVARLQLFTDIVNFESFVNHIHYLKTKYFSRLRRYGKRRMEDWTYETI